MLSRTPYTCKNRLSDAVGRPGERGRGVRRLGGDQDRHDRQVVAAQMEILQIERVVVDLVDRASVELFCADLEFDHVDRVAGDEDRVRALAHSGDEELQEQLAHLPVREDVFQDLDLGDPSVALVGSRAWACALASWPRISSVGVFKNSEIGASKYEMVMDGMKLLPGV